MALRWSPLPAPGGYRWLSPLRPRCDPGGLGSPRDAKRLCVDALDGALEGEEGEVAEHGGGGEAGGFDEGVDGGFLVGLKCGEALLLLMGAVLI